MNDTSREAKINDAFVAMTEALMKNYDIVDLLSTLLNACTDILGVDAGGILLTDSVGNLELVASTSEEAHIVETIIIAAGAGPCIDCYNTASAVSATPIANAASEAIDRACAATWRAAWPATLPARLMCVGASRTSR